MEIKCGKLPENGVLGQCHLAFIPAISRFLTQILMQIHANDSLIPEFDLVLQDLKAEELHMIVTDRRTHYY